MPVLPFTAVELFQGISASDAQKILSLSTEKRFRRGATIFSAGESSNCVYVLKSGFVKLTSFSEMGKEAILDILKPDEVFGELLLSEEKRAFTAIAVEDVLVTVVSRERFLKILLSVPIVALNFIRVLSKRLAEVETGLTESSHTWSYDRLAKALLHLSEKYGEKVPGGTLIKLRLTHEDLANLIGTTRETVTTQLNKFSRMGLVKRQARRLIVARTRLREFVRSEELRVGNLHVS